MKGYTCDQCGKSKGGTPAVEVRGVSRRSGILLPSALQEHVFCEANCFWLFFNDQGPAHVTRIPEKEHDVSKDRARVLHRIVRALHDGNCPKCGALHHPDEITVQGGERCPSCGFSISSAEAAAAMKEFREIMQANLEIFEKWRASR